MSHFATYSYVRNTILFSSFIHTMLQRGFIFTPENCVKSWIRRSVLVCFGELLRKSHASDLHRLQNNNKNWRDVPPLQQQDAPFHAVCEKHPGEFIWNHQVALTSTVLWSLKGYQVSISSRLRMYSHCLYVHTLIPRHREISLDGIKVEVHQTASTHWSRREALRTAWPQSWKLLSLFT